MLVGSKEWTPSFRSHCDTVDKGNDDGNELLLSMVWGSFQFLSLVLISAFPSRLPSLQHTVYVSVSFHMHHNRKASSRLNIESNWSYPHVTFGMLGLVWCTMIFFDLSRPFEISWTRSDSFSASFPASSKPLAFCCPHHALFLCCENYDKMTALD